MAFSDVAALTEDGEFHGRLAACVHTESLGKTGDAFADDMLKMTPESVATVWAPPIAASPGFGDKYAAGGQESITDADMLSAVQSGWSRISGLYRPPVTP